MPHGFDRAADFWFHHHQRALHGDATEETDVLLLERLGDDVVEHVVGRALRRQIEHPEDGLEQLVALQIARAQRAQFRLHLGVVKFLLPRELVELRAADPELEGSDNLVELQLEVVVLVGVAGFGRGP